MSATQRFIVLSCVLCGWTLSLAAADSQQTAAALKETLAQLNALDQWFSESEERRNRWLVEIKNQDAQVSDISRAVGKVRDEILETSSELEEVNTHNQQLLTKRKQQAQLVGEHVASAYRLSGQDFLKQLLNQESPDKFERMIRYHKLFSESRLKLLDEYRQTLAELEQSNALLTEKHAELTGEQERLEEQQASLTEQRKERSVLIANLDAEVESKQEEYRRLEQDRERLENLLEQLRRAAQELDGTDFVSAKGSLPMPVSGSIRHAYGSRRAEGRLTWHGIDIRADLGTPVRAVYRGRVVFSDWLRGFGLLTILDHGAEYMTLYGHADALYKKEGDLVEIGEPIATAGNSGGRNETGIYFEVRHKGKTVDPITWVKR